MQLYLYPLRYNNYGNRIIKKFDDLTGYVPYYMYNHGGMPVYFDINFQLGDGIDTQQVLTDWKDFDNPDYVVAYNPETKKIHSRWFVIDSNYLSSTSYQLRLHRDVIADNLDKVLNSTCLIERGYLNNNNPLVYNPETNISFNQIKKGQYLLDEDGDRFPWLVAYIDRKTGQQADSIDIKFWSGVKQTAQGTLPDWINNLIGDEIRFMNNDLGITSYEYNAYGLEHTIYLFASEYHYINNKGKLEIYDKESGGTYFRQNSYTNSEAESAYKLVNTRVAQAINADGKNTVWHAYSYETCKKLLNNSGKIFTTPSGNRQLVVNKVKTISDSVNVSAGLTKEAIKDAFDLTHTTIGEYDDKLTQVKLNNDIVLYSVSLEAVDAPYQYEAKWDYTNGNYTLDAPYEIVAIPYSKSLAINQGSNFLRAKTALAFMQQIKASLSKAAYDVQIVPYLDLNKLGFTVTRVGNTIILQTNETNTIQIKQVGSGSVKGIAYKLNSQNGNLTINSPNIPVRLDNHKSVTLDKYRLVSPNGHADFEFSPAKNGSLDKFDVEYTLKPYTPYYNISPVFGGLYGQDYQDYRGLILSGDFSLAQLTDEWKSYQINNKNYQAIFDRQIETMDYMRDFERAEGILGAVTGSMQGAATGAVIGSVGGPAGAIAGGIVGGVTSAVGGVADIVHSEAKYQRNKEDTILNYNWNLGNIKARPQTLSKDTSLTIDNPLMPYIEYYTCTDEEEAIYDNIMKYQGMTVGIIGKPVDYLNYNQDKAFIKATIIEMELDDDSHQLATINDELSTGVRIYVDSI